HQRPADRELLLLTARKVASAPSKHLVEHREQGKNVVRNAAVFALERSKPGFEIFLDREQGKDFAALRHIGDAAAGTVGRLQLGDVGAVERDRTAADRMLAGERIEEGGLADAIASEHAGHLARLRRERHRTQRLCSAVVEIDGVDVEHNYRPRYTSTTRSFCDTWSMDPSAMTVPSCRHVNLTPRSPTKVMSCSTTITVRSRLISLSSSAVCRVSASVRPATGSSTRRSLGSWASSMPISSHCFCPCDRLPATRSRSGDSRTTSRMLSIRRSSSVFGRQNKVARERRSLLSARRILSSTVCISNTVGLWNLRPRPSMAISVSSSAVRSCVPLKKTSPSSGRVLPVTTSIMVVLPAPFGPMIARISPGATVSDRLLSALKPSKETLTPSR